MKKTALMLGTALCLNACTDDALLPTTPADPQAQTGIMTRATGDCEIGNGQQKMHFTQTDGGYTTQLLCYGQSYTPRQGAMVMLQVWAAGLSSSTLCTATYDSICTNLRGDSLIAYATLQTDKGSSFFVTDTYTTSAAHPALRLVRDIVVLVKKTGDAAFNSLLLIAKASPQDVSSSEYYLPALVFKDGTNMSESSIGATWTDDWILAREERMGLPLTMMRDKKTGIALSVCDYNPSPTTTSADWGNTHLSNAAFRYASLGFNLEGDAPALAYCFPGSEGERSYCDGAGHAERLWARRSTPLVKNARQHYELDFLATRSDDFATAQRDHWRAAFDRYAPEVLDVSSQTVLDVSLEVLDHYWLKSGGAPGFPFSVYCSDGKVHETSFDMGFVGMQVACAYYLYRYGLDHGNEVYRKKGEQVLDFWADHSANGDGMPRVWYDIEPWNSWRNSNDLRNMQGGLEAMLLAWSCAEAARPGCHANWLRFCKGAADFLIAKQNSDGSFPKAFDNNGNVSDNGTFLTSNLLRFLTAMYGVTCKPAYRTAIVKAADWCVKNISQPCKYIGSVIDNPYVKDRESGQKMLEAMLAAYDLTGDDKYLQAARQAAYYTVSYMYAWNIPWESGTTLAMPWPKKKTTVGITIIATGHSGADCGFSYNSFEFLRLYELTADPYFLRIARLLEKNTKQTMDYDGSLRYAWRGLQREAIRCVTHRGDSVALWLPWCTAAALDPLFRMEDAYGRIGVDEITANGSATSASMRLDASRYARKLGVVRLPDGIVY